MQDQAITHEYHKQGSDNVLCAAYYTTFNFSKPIFSYVKLEE